MAILAGNGIYDGSTITTFNPSVAAARNFPILASGTITGITLYFNNSAGRDLRIGLYDPDTLLKLAEVYLGDMATGEVSGVFDTSVPVTVGDNIRMVISMDDYWHSGCNSNGSQSWNSYVITFSAVDALPADLNGVTTGSSTAEYAFAFDLTGSTGTGTNLGVRSKQIVQQDGVSPIPDATDAQILVLDGFPSGNVLLSSNAGVISNGVITVDDNAVGALSDAVELVYKSGDFMGITAETVIDLDA